jgi:hypothetical protein
MSKAADDWAKKMGTGWEKAPVQMLAQVTYPCILLYIFPHTAMFALILLCMFPHTEISSVLILLYMCPHTATQVHLACGDGGPCPAGPAFIRKSGLTSDAEVAWSKTMHVEDASDKAPTMMLKQQALREQPARAAQQVGKDVTSYLFTKASQAGL